MIHSRVGRGQFERQHFERQSSTPLGAASNQHGRCAERRGLVVAAGVVALSLGMGCGGQSGLTGRDDALGGSSGGSGSSGQSDGRGDETADAAADGPSNEPTLSVEQFEAAVVAAPDLLDRVDTSGGAWRMIEVPGATSSPEVVRTASGWMALSHRYLGDSKAPSGVETALYRSRDGIHWQLMPLDSGGNDLRLVDLAYGGGRYVMVGTRYGGDAIVWTSSDGEGWTEWSQSLSGSYAWSRVAFVRDRFFAFGFGQLAASTTGESWEALPTQIVQGGAGAYGNGRYLLLGNGPMQTSEDGQTWQTHSLDCALPGSCITNPSGGVAQGYHHSALFAEGRFYTEELSSLDGASWEAQPGLSPAAYLGGRFLGSSSLLPGLAAWTPGGAVQTLRVIRPARAAVTAAGRDGAGVVAHDAPLPDTVDVPFEDGLTCEGAACLLIGDSLLLVPPPGAPPLVDRVPRDASGVPLLTRECPVSSMLFCDDYTARSGCVCNTAAPRSPEYCGDVSHYRCAGQFVARPGEWPLEELAQAGCSCDAVDPNQPVGFGRNCAAGDGTCQAPLECLGIDTPPSPGPPPEQPFVCTTRCEQDADCPSWEASGFCSGPVRLRCSGGTCQPRSCD